MDSRRLCDRFSSVVNIRIPGMMVVVFLNLISNTMACFWVADPKNYEDKEEPTLGSHEEVIDASQYSNTVERDKLLFSVFSLLHKLGADERPEVIQIFSCSKSKRSIFLFNFERSSNTSSETQQLLFSN